MTAEILVPLHTFPDGNSAAIGGHVSAVARHLGADVHGLVLNTTIPPMSSLTGTMIIDVGAMAHDIAAKGRARGEALVRALDDALGQAVVGFRHTSLDCVMGAAGSGLVSGARYHDLSLVALCADDRSMEATAEALIFGSGRPTLLVPQDAPPSRYQHVLVAWDGSRVATRAVADAREFLRLAKTVTIVSVTDEKALSEEGPGRNLAGHLRRHGIEATVSELRSHARQIGSVLQDHALEIGADMMVMGAFGHSRMRDFVMGGATKGILQDLRLPVLLSH